MKQLLVVFFLLYSSLVFTQSYVDLGIRHFAVGEYDEAMIDFKNAEEIVSMITESSKAKLYYYRGMIWLKKAQKSSGKFAEEDPLQLSYQDLTKVTYLDKSWKPHIEEAYDILYSLIAKEADLYLKLEKKEDELNSKLTLLDARINYLEMAKDLEVSSMPVLYLGQTNKQAGDLIFDNSSDLIELQKARKYYEKSLEYYEVARYDDPFSKEIIEDLLTIAKRLGDADRIKEYEKLLQLAGG
ncbi:hypothetical protein [Ekhidna sp.]|uniref:hypothetical protein n=1 Tax=Ekhidna sp. TaxID=2608089 RepID=UPI00329A7F05